MGFLVTHSVHNSATRPTSPGRHALSLNTFPPKSISLQQREAEVHTLPPKSHLTTFESHVRAPNPT